MARSNNRIPKPQSADEKIRANNIMNEVLSVLAKQEGNPTQEEAIVNRAKEIATKVWRAYEVAVSVDPKLRFSKANATLWLCQNFIDEFRHLSKEELLFLVAMLHTELVLENM